MSQTHTVTISILDKEYQVSCPPDERAELQRSASYLDEQMRAIRDTGKVIGLERIAVMAALNISYELIRAARSDEAPEVDLPDDASVQTAFRSLNSKLDEALHQLRQIEIT